MKLEEIIDIEFLQKVQDAFAKATGLAAITVDYRGNPITKYSNFSKFCNIVRKDPNLMAQCFKCDAFGGLEAARIGHFYVYHCHCGLVDFAVPIIVQGQYLGSMLVGQARMDEKDNEKLDYIVKESPDWKENHELIKEYEKIPIISYEKITAAAEMMFYVINHIFEREIMKYVHEELQKKNQQLINQMKVSAELEKALLNKQIQSLHLLLNPYFLFNTMNTLTCLSIIEEAPKTQEAILTLFEMLKYIITNNQNLVQLKEELAFIEKYLLLQKLRFNDRLRVMIDIPKEFESITIPPFLLQAIIDNAVIHGIEPKDGNGNISVKGYSLSRDYVFVVSDDGVGMAKEKMDRIFEDNSKNNGGKWLKGMGLNYVNSVLISLYGDEYKLSISQNSQGGITVRMRIPKN
ncbi:PocR ligand-binding domain-containing protein [Parageobacillus thermoglucosidasius]|uniref:PocR ligand-binding domain-containing protein n=1 Tax=Parageobacillus thermoglucosidasius TaxID=1426 RepID=UPI000E16FD9D|nr:PocR ligand-binding domain-containing protein [Parageobacillus thermoglucosidasius]RDE23413.1 histidine kinase [Parageobacillus thermoglucosidasius]RDE31175.1 histidine kinase [Parageobacillus thermoglucosidasius]